MVVKRLKTEKLRFLGLKMDHFFGPVFGPISGRKSAISPWMLEKRVPKNIDFVSFLTHFQTPLEDLSSKSSQNRAQIQQEVSRTSQIRDHFLITFLTPMEVRLRISSKYCTNRGGVSNQWSRTRFPKMTTYACPRSRFRAFPRFTTIF